jgi:hypothetical protein
LRFHQFRLISIYLWKLPSEDIPITIVVGRHSFPILTYFMNDFYNPVDKTNYLFSKLLNGLRELVDITDGED